MKRYATVAALLVLLLSLGSCADGGNGGGGEPAQESRDATLYFVADTPTGFRLYPEVHEVPAGDDPALAALRALVDEGVAPLDPDYVSLWADSGSSILSLTREGDVATLDLDLGTLNVGAESEQRAIDELLWTAADSDPTIEAMRILVDGEAIESLAGHVDATGTFELGDGLDVLAGVVISSPAEGEELSGEVVVEGEACTFEANVAWELLRDGQVVDGGSTTAAEACPTRSAWSVSLGTLDPGDYTFRASELSARDGSLVVEDTKRFTVSA